MNMEKYKEFTRAQLEKELAHHEELLQALTIAHGQLNTSLMSLQLVNQRQQKEILAQQNSMMDMMEQPAKEGVTPDGETH